MPIFPAFSAPPIAPTAPILPSGKPVDAYILIRQLIHLLTTFLTLVQRTHIRPSGRGILQKNLMFRYSSEANILLACARELVSKYTSNLDLGQPSPTVGTANTWNLSTSFPGFARVLSLTHGDAEALFGKFFARRFQKPRVWGHGEEEEEEEEGEEGVRTPRFYRPAAELGFSRAEHERISSALSAQYAMWNNAIANFRAHFNPLTPLVAVELMADTALTLRTAALAAIKLVEHDLRIALGLRPITGTLEAKLVYLAIVKETGGKEGLEAKIKKELFDVCKEGEARWDELVRREYVEGYGGGITKPDWLERLGG
ncbi:hypothetical protein C7212DRAFT_362603 [Tuber magnatum]|uniref:Uncharacterized protein n=1 Tax=Tuber magnatum TaxID=42249 RepID=A0A317STW1_9PEZI|nr:hypothetical protein C7212DRAFT_362603 [Tuber magnatum]